MHEPFSQYKAGKGSLRLFILVAFLIVFAAPAFGATSSAPKPGFFQTAWQAVVDPLSNFFVPFFTTRPSSVTVVVDQSAASTTTATGVEKKGTQPSANADNSSTESGVPLTEARTRFGNLAAKINAIISNGLDSTGGQNGITREKLTDLIQGSQSLTASSFSRAYQSFTNIFESDYSFESPSISGSTAISGPLSISEAGTTITGKAAAPTLVGHINSTGNTYYSLAVQGNYAYALVLSGPLNGMQIFDISNPASPVARGSLVTNSSPENIQVYGKYAYIVGFSNTYIVDVSDPDRPVLASTIGSGGGSSHALLQGKYLYVIGGFNGVFAQMRIYDISNPYSPRGVSTVTRSTAGFGQWAPYHASIQGNYIYSGRGDGGSPVTPGFDVIDISNPLAPQLVGSTTIGISRASRVTAVSGRYAYIQEDNGRKIHVIDISNPAAPRVVNTISSATAGFSGVTFDGYQSMVIQGDWLYVGGAGYSHLVIIDVSDPLNPHLVSYGVSGGSSGHAGYASSQSYIAVSGNYVYLASQGRAFSVVDVSGLMVSNIDAGGVKAGKLSISNDLSTIGGISVAGGIAAGSGQFTSGVGVYSTTTNIALSVAGTSYFNGLIGIATTSPYAQLSVTGTNVASTTFAIRPAASQTASIVDIYNPSGTLSASFTSANSFGFGTSSPYAKISISSTATASTTLALRPIASQTANIFDIYSTTGTLASVMTAAGNLGIGTSSPQRLLHVYRSSDGAPVRIEDSNGYCEIDPTSTSWTCTSDIRKKKNIISIDATSTLSKILSIRPVTFEWKKQTSSDRRTGFIAQEVENIYPEFVTTDEFGFKSVAYGSFVPVIVSALQGQEGSSQLLKSKLQDVEDSLFATSSPQSFSGLVAGIRQALTNGIAHLSDLAIQTFTVHNLTIKNDSDVAATGFVIYDRATRAPLCVYFENGIKKTEPGECRAATATSQETVSTTTSQTNAATTTVQS